MELNVEWYKPVPLRDGEKQNCPYVVDDLKQLGRFPGVYMFCRVHDGIVFPLYIGKSVDVSGRIGKHLRESIKLMNGIKAAAEGEKVIIRGKFIPKPGQSVPKCIAVIERALIDHALSKQYKLLNVQGTKTQVHHVNFSGYPGALDITGQTLSREA